MSLKEKVEKKLKGSWRTTVIGWAGLVAAICLQAIALLDSDPATKISMEAILTALASVGLIASRDDSVTSEDSKASRSEP